MEKLIFNQEIQKQFMAMHDLIVKSKFYFLKAVQFQSLSDDQKNNLRDRITDIADKISRHFNEIKYAKITQYNIDKYERNEEGFIKGVRKRGAISNPGFL